MLIVVANDLPPAVRGRMKLWFVEVRPNTFVSGVKDSVADTVIDYLYKHCTDESGIMMFRSLNRSPGYDIKVIGETKKELILISGLQLVVETLKN